MTLGTSVFTPDPQVGEVWQRTTVASNSARYALSSGHDLPIIFSVPCLIDLSP